MENIGPPSITPGTSVSAQPSGGNLDHKIQYRPDFAFLTVRLPAGETMKVEASAMASMDTNIAMKTKFRGGFKRFLTGESIFINEFTAEGGPGELCIAPGPPGDMEHFEVNENKVLYLSSSAFVASAMSVNVDTKWDGFVKGFFSGNGLFLIRCSGQGSVFFNSFGSIIPINVTSEFVVDTSYVVGFTDGLQYGVTSVGGYKSLFLSGEGLVCRFTGQGTVWIQTRQVPSFSWWINAFRRVQRNSSD